MESFPKMSMPQEKVNKPEEKSFDAGAVSSLISSYNQAEYSQKGTFNEKVLEAEQNLIKLLNSNEPKNIEIALTQMYEMLEKPTVQPNPFLNSVAKITQQNLNNLKQMANSDNTNKTKIGGLLVDLLNKKQVIQVATPNENTEQLVKEIGESYLKDEDTAIKSPSYAKVVSFLTREGDESDAKKYADKIFELASSKNTTKIDACKNVVSDILRNSNNDPKVENLVKGILSSFGLDADKFISTWTSGTSGYRSNDVINGNLETVFGLESRLPGSTGILNKDFGITNFGRYPSDVLIDQCRNLENTDKEYGIALFARDDHNLALTSGEKLTLHKLSSELKKEDCLLRIVESESNFQTARQLISLDKKYGQKQKISFVYIVAHANYKLVSFGNSDRGTITKDGLAGDGVARVKEFFSENPTIIFSACEVGKKDGIGEDFSSVMDAKVIAPKKQTKGLEDISITRDSSGKLDFKVKFKEDSLFSKNTRVIG